MLVVSVAVPDDSFGPRETLGDTEVGGGEILVTVFAAGILQG